MFTSYNGKHYCFNVVTEKQNVPGAVLIRALEPIKGIENMKKNRRARNVLNLTNGPGKLTEAMNITGKQNGLDLTKSKELFICNRRRRRGLRWCPQRELE